MKNNKSEYNKLFNLSHKSDYYLTNKKTRPYALTMHRDEIYSRGTTLVNLKSSLKINTEFNL